MNPKSWAFVCVFLAFGVQGCMDASSPSTQTNFIRIPQSAHPVREKACTTEPAFDGRFCRADIAGWTVWLSASLVEKYPAYALKVVDLAAEQLREISAAMPERRLVELQRVPIWIDHNGPSNARAMYQLIGGTWVRQNGYPEAMTGGVYVADAERFLHSHLYAPSTILHELAHAYHDQVLGYDHPAVKRAYQNALDKKLYLAVKRNTGTSGTAYALKNEREYFAELTEAYFATSGTFPFNRDDLKAYDSIGYEMVRSVWEDYPALRPRDVVLAEGTDPCRPHTIWQTTDMHLRSRLVIRNASPFSLTLMWIDRRGDRKVYGRIPPGALLAQSSFFGNQWVFVDEAGRCRASFIPDSPALWIRLSAVAP